MLRYRRLGPRLEPFCRRTEGAISRNSRSQRHELPRRSPSPMNEVSKRGGACRHLRQRRCGKRVCYWSLAVRFATESLRRGSNSRVRPLSIPRCRSLDIEESCRRSGCRDKGGAPDCCRSAKKQSDSDVARRPGECLVGPDRAARIEARRGGSLDERGAVCDPRRRGECMSRGVWRIEGDAEARRGIGRNCVGDSTAGFGGETVVRLRRGWTRRRCRICLAAARAVRGHAEYLLLGRPAGLDGTRGMQAQLSTARPWRVPRLRAGPTPRSRGRFGRLLEATGDLVTRRNRN